MRRALFVARLGLVDAWRAKGRVALMWAITVLATFVSLIAVAGMRDYRASAHELASLMRDDATVFQVVYPENWFPEAAWPGQPFDALLRQALSPRGDATSTFSYPLSSQCPIPIYVCLGHCPDYTLEVADHGGHGAVIGADVKGIMVGDAVAFGPYEGKVVGRLPKGATLMVSVSPCDVPRALDDSIVFVAGYSHMVDSVDPAHASSIGPIFDSVLAFLKVRTWDDERIREFVAAAAQSTSVRLLPHPVSESADVIACRTGMAEMAWWAVGLVAMSVTAFFSALGHVLRATLREHGVHRLAGATLLACRGRLAVFATVLVAAPVGIAVMASLSIPHLEAVGPWLWLVVAVVVVGVVVAVEASCRVVARRALLVATRGVE